MFIGNIKNLIGFLNFFRRSDLYTVVAARLIWNDAFFDRVGYEFECCASDVDKYSYSNKIILYASIKISKFIYLKR